MSVSTPCPSCRQPMQTLTFDGNDGRPIELDLCFACQGLWFDPTENTRLAPAAVLRLFEQLHAHQGQAHAPLQPRLHCPRCPQELAKGFDVAQGGRYVTYRCPARHGRFSTFGSFLVEKGFVRHLNASEIDTLAQRVGAIACTQCGGTIDIRNEHACPWCGSAISLLDPEAVERALQRYGAVMQEAKAARSPDKLADALVALERLNARDERERQKERRDGGAQFDLVEVGVELVWSLFRR